MSQEKHEELQNESLENDHSYSFMRGGEWSLPLRVSVLKAWAESGYLSQDTQLQRIDSNNQPVGNEEVVSQKFKMIQKGNLTLENGIPIDKNKVSTIKESVDAADKVLKEFTSLLNKDKFIDTIEALLKVSKVLSKVSAGLAFLGAVLGVFSLFFSRKSDTEIILEAIAGIGKKITNLEISMLNQLENLTDIMKEHHALTQIRQYVNSLATLNRDVLQYTGYVQENNLREQETKKKELLKHESLKIREAILGIASQSTGQNLATNIFEETYKVSHGNASVIAELGAFLSSFAAFGLIADTFIQTLSVPDDDDKMDKIQSIAKVNNDFYLPLIKSINDSWESCHKRCITDVQSNFIDKINKKGILPSILLLTDNKKVSSIIIDLLKDQWSWIDWLVLVFDHSGFSQPADYSMKGDNYRTWPTGTKLIVVHFVDKKKEALGKNWDTSCTYKTEDLFNEYLEHGKIKGGVQYFRTKSKHLVEWPNIDEAFKLMDKPIQEGGFICLLKKGIKYGHKNTNENRVLFKVGNDTYIKNEISKNPHAPQYIYGTSSKEYAVFVHH